MTLKELIEKEKELCSKLLTVREEINKMERSETIALLEEAIKCLEHIDNINSGNLKCFFGIECAECGGETETFVSLEEIYKALNDLKEDLS